MTGLFLAGSDPTPYRRRPCARCLWRRDTPTGQFTTERYVQLRSTSPQHGHDEPGWGAPMFSYHKTPEGREMACAGWIATVADRHLRLRLALAQRRIPHRVLTPGKGWPALFET
ncbi:DUF6283 family protein [Embleya sp. AB8]|uniref:DUF6283 family protein n=1 Tax=Embleya sp. AB8 TaxID=3156304 RepID=UPI003C769567